MLKSFSPQKINGDQLKLLNESSLKSLGVHVDFFKTQSLLLAVDNLKQNDYVQPRNFNEFMVKSVVTAFLASVNG